MNGVLLPIYAFMAWTGTTFTFISAYILIDWGEPRETSVMIAGTRPRIEPRTSDHERG
jgi:hypothetical protein